MKILLISKDDAIYKNIKREVDEESFDITFLNAVDMTVPFIKKTRTGIVIADIETEKTDGLNLLKAIKHADPQTEVIFIGDDTLDMSCIEAVNCGAYDYITKPVDAPELAETLSAIHRKSLFRQEVGELEEKLIEKYEFNGMVGKNPQMLEVFSFIRRIAKHPTTVLITGETGTGKELVAKAIHNLSQRKKNKFVSCNCAALAESLLESELFGHVKGAFTGAHQTKHGLFEYGDRGTVFLDEIGDISLATQTRLLGILENREIQRVGSNETIKVDARIISATNKNLEEAINKSHFRKDLFYRLNVAQVHLPPLRERKEDVPLLCSYFLRKCNEKYDKHIKGISRPAKLVLMNYHWPGNIRELEHAIERAVSLTSKNFISNNDLPPSISASAPHSKMKNKNNEGLLTEDLTLEELEKRYILKILKKTGGNKVRAANVLGLSRRSLYRKLEKYDKNN